MYNLLCHAFHPLGPLSVFAVPRFLDFVQKNYLPAIVFRECFAKKAKNPVTVQTREGADGVYV